MFGLEHLVFAYGLRHGCDEVFLGIVREKNFLLDDATQ